MREIKFRAWHPENKDMTVFDNEKASNDPFIAKHLLMLMANKHELGVDLLMQFTGLQDKNGVDIYEGDIVSVLFTDWASQSKDDDRSPDEYKESLEKVFPVCFHKGAFQISGKGYYGNDIGYDDIECGKHGYIKVIGNIHENPELLKGSE